MRSLNVCGGHERTIAFSGLRTLLPKGVELLPGPGCPVCVCAEEDLRLAITLALEGFHVVAFGDMLRVPIAADVSSLVAARQQGAKVTAIASPLEALKLALANPQEAFVFFAAGFETTMAPIAACIASGLPDNLYFLLAGKRTSPAVYALLQDGLKIDALIAPGHVAAIVGCGEWRTLAEDRQCPVDLAGFDAASFMQAIDLVLKAKGAFFANAYAEVVKEEGNCKAQQLLREAFTVTPARWRGIGMIPASGFTLQDAWQKHNARLLLPQPFALKSKEMPKGCACAKVLCGKIYPQQCPLYGQPCTPDAPIGPCMVSDEGACHIAWQSGWQNALIS
jgi:hydrogenase expression/formation protein HypD